MRDGDTHSGCIRCFAHLEKCRVMSANFNRLFPEDDVHFTGKPRHEVLWALEDEIPTQVRKAKQGSGVWIWRRGLKQRLNWHPDARQHFPLYLRDFGHLDNAG